MTLSANWVRHWDHDQRIPFGVIENQWVGYDDAETTNHKVGMKLKCSSILVLDDNNQKRIARV